MPLIRQDGSSHGGHDSVRTTPLSLVVVGIVVVAVAVAVESVPNIKGRIMSPLLEKKNIY